MKTETAIRRAGSMQKLANLLGVTRQAVQSYKRHGLPESRVAELREKRPTWFPAPKTKPAAEATPAA